MSSSTPARFFLHRDIIKKKRDEQMKMVWRISAQHKKLQSRMEHMRKFRRQHEQLRTVIVRVLRPSVRDAAAPVEGEDLEQSKPTLSLDAADANAIEVRFSFFVFTFLKRGL
jgi:dynein heavy chain 1